MRLRLLALLSLAATVASCCTVDFAGDRTRFDNKSWRALEESIGAELVGFNLPEPAASWARGYANN